jgi:hypothetical protein
MLLKNKYVIGTMVMFYELDAIKDFISSIKSATSSLENKENITIEFLLNLSEYSELIDSPKTNKEELIELFHSICIQPLEGLNVVYDIYQDTTKLYSIGSYRRDLNYKHCLTHDFIVWGESDCMMPEQYFDSLETISSYATQENINRFCVTFSIRKMWDDSWNILEHPQFENSQFLQSDDERCPTTPSSIWYYMSQDEMNLINNQTDSFDLRIINYPRFDGSLLTISSDLLLTGVNIPPSIQGTGEDTSFQTMISTIMGDKYKQFVVKNILKVHNRNHPYKRNYILGEDSTISPRNRRSKNEIFDKVHKTSYYNLSILGANQNKFEKL